MTAVRFYHLVVLVVAGGAAWLADELLVGVFVLLYAILLEVGS